MEPSHPEPSRAGYILLALMLFFVAGFLGVMSGRNVGLGVAGAGFAIAGGLVILAATQLRR